MISSKENSVKSDLEQYFDHFRENIVGINQTFQSPYGEQKLIYTDWTASGRLYAPIEDKMRHQFGPFVQIPIQKHLLLEPL